MDLDFKELASSFEMAIGREKKEKSDIEVEEGLVPENENNQKTVTYGDRGT